MSEMDPSEVKPAQPFLEAWWAFLRCEHVRSKGGGDAAERAADRKAALSHLRLTDDQAIVFQLAGWLAFMAGPLIVSIVFDDWFTRHDLHTAGSSANWQGLAAELGLFLLSYVVVSFGMAVIWLRVRQPMDGSR